MSQARLLIVDDDPVCLEVLNEILAGDGYEIVTATCGEDAWRLVADVRERFDVIVLDRMMPDIDGIEVLRRMKAEERLTNTPVVMQTAMTAPADVTEGLRAGAYYYLTKPFSPETLLAIVNAAIEDSREWLELRDEAQQAAHTLVLLDEARFSFRTPDEVRNIATLIANVGVDPGRIVVGISELMLNAIEHGNLAITYEEKTQLITAGRLHDEVDRRLALPQYEARVAYLLFWRTPDELQFLIRDQGGGFAWEKYIDLTPERAFDTHGRGIAMSRMLSFDRLEYRGAGNEVFCTIRNQPAP